MSDLPTALVEERLRDTYRAVTTRTDYSVAPALVPDATSTPTPVHRRRPMVALVGVALVVALVVGVLALVERNDASTPRPTTPPVDAGPIFPPVQTHVGPALHLAPAGLPAGFSLVRAWTTPQSGPWGGSYSGTAQLWVKLDPSGRVRGMFTVVWRPLVDGVPGRSINLLDETLAHRPHTRVDLGGHEGWRRGRFVHFADEGSFVTVGSHRRSGWPDVLSTREVVSVARGVERAADGGYRASSPPRGYRLAADALPSQRGPGDDVRTLVYADGAGHVFSVQLANDTTTPPGAALQSPSDLRVVPVRGMNAIVTSRLVGDPMGCDDVDRIRCQWWWGLPASQRGVARFLQWLEPDTTMVTVATYGLDDEVVRRIARSLREVPQEEWDQLAASAPSR